VLLDGHVIADLPLTTLFNGSWVISERTMTSEQIDHLLAHANEWEEWQTNKAAACTDMSSDSSFTHGILLQDLPQYAQALVLRPEDRQMAFNRDESSSLLDLIPDAIEVD
jgi:hypothetical protein